MIIINLNVECYVPFCFTTSVLTTNTFVANISHRLLIHKDNDHGKNDNKTDVIIINNDNDNLYTIESSSDQVQYLCSYQSCGFKNIPVLKFQSK